MKKAKFVKKLIKLLQDATEGCAIQHKGCPCRTCFFELTDNKLMLGDDFAQKFWDVVLVLRGDYSEDQIRKLEEG